MNRILYIDALRGLAVVFMVQQHLQSWLWHKEWISYSYTFPEHPVMLILNFFGNFAAPLFLVLAGMGSALICGRRGTSSCIHLKRGLFLLLCGYMLNILSPHWFRPGSWYILHAIGTGLILSPLLLRMKNAYLLISGILVLSAAPVLQTWLQTPLMSGNNFMNDVSGRMGFFRVMFAEGHFPLFPWLAFFIAGILCTRWISEGKYKYILISAVTAFITGGVFAFCYEYGFFFATGGLFFRFFVNVLYIYPPFTPLMFFLMGTAFIFLFLFGMGRSREESILTGALSAMGRCSLSLFFIHILFFNEVLRLFGVHKCLSAGRTLGITAASLVLVIFFSVKWRKYNYIFGLEWFMRKLF